ncbi:MAG: glycosyltransferase family A protein [Spirochaetales bacterium]|nr:glycosyltransferase family A protein [Spirochaetales bacterium]
MNNPLFSVVIPAYNKAPHIQRAIESVLNQSNKDYELIVIDDASTDNSLSIIRDILKEVQNAIVLERDEPGPGGYAARNLGIHESRGKWIAFLDADDEWYPGLLDEYHQIIENNCECKFIATAQKRVSEDGIETLDPYSKKNKQNDIKIFDLLEYSIAGGMGQNPIQTSSVCVSKNLLLEIGGFPHKRCVRGGDRDTWLRLLMVTDLYWTPFIGAVYYRDTVNMVTIDTPKSLTPCHEKTYKDILQNTDLRCKYGRGLCSIIKKQSNYEKKSLYKQMVFHGKLQMRDLKHLYKSQDLIFTAILIFFAVLPGRLQKKIVRLFFFKGK